MKFNSQICTAKEQSERLLALELKQETADCFLEYVGRDNYGNNVWHPSTIVNNYKMPDYSRDIPAWSLHRLIEIMPSNIIENEKRYNFSLDHGCSLYEYNEINEFGDYEYDCIGTSKNTFNLYDDLINQIEWLIERNHFNKEYLN